ncbi:MAG TPA: DEAD/DEAH box helicase family protein [Patescibacteria group bacterium]|nr:DEAD/DEAH box helicase family protein [Patescibacteria group bacterium]
MISFEQIQLFMSLFKGRNDIYARRWEKNGKSGYSPAYELNWQEFAAFKAKGGKFSDFPNKKPLILTTEVIQGHLNGVQTVGIYPLLTDNTSYFVAADFDKENWQEESKAFAEICSEYKIPAYIERSRSGNGAHVWIFFEERYPANKSRAIMLELIRQALKLSDFEKEVSFDRLFPNQDYHTNQGFGNLIALPLQGVSITSGNTAFLDSELKEIPDQWQSLKEVRKISTQALDKLYRTLIENDVQDTTSNLPSSRTTNKKQLTIIMESAIKLSKVSLQPQLVKFLRDKLNFFNTEYLVKEKMGISTYQTEKYFKLISESGEYVLIPRGFLPQLITFCKTQKLRYELVDKRKLQDETTFKPKITLYDYQKVALSEIADQEYGVIVAPPGAGKTILGLKLIADKSQPTLILVHRKQLLDQWIDRIQSFLCIPKKEIGQISGSKKTLGKQITVAMMQSLIKMDDEGKQKFTQTFGTIIIDECHHIPAKTFRELITQFNPYYLYGLTATPKRKYNDEKLIYYYIGEILTTIDPNKEKKQSRLNSGIKNTNVEIHETSLSVPFERKIDTFEVLSKVLVFDSNRNTQITQDIIIHVIAGKKIVVLTERKEHVEVLNLYLKSHCEVITLTGDDSTSKRKLKLDQLKLGHFQVLIATGQLLGEGLDLPILDCLFLVYPFSFEGKLIQYIGRIQRSENQRVIVDYIDRQVPFFEKMFKKRNKFYQKSGWL